MKRPTASAILLSLVSTFFLPHPASAYYNYPPADIVIGQPDFTSSALNQGGSAAGNTFRNPAQTAVINGKLFIADSQNNRILVWNEVPTTHNSTADFVIGQQDFTSVNENEGPAPGVPGPATAHTLDRSSAMASDGTKLIILDRDNHRVLIYNTIPTASYPAADVVIGHPTMSEIDWCGGSTPADINGIDADCFSSGPNGMTYDADSGKLIVADNDNDRILIWNSLPTTNGVAANVVVGQADFTHNVANQGGSADANTLDLSTGSIVGTYQGKLLVADRLNNRVLVFNTIPTTNNASADVVIGQTDFTSTAANQGGAISARGLDNPRGATVDSEGRLFIVDGNNARVLIYNSIPTTNNAAADYVIGQPDFTTVVPGATQQRMQTFAYHVSFFPGHFIVSDGGNFRILIFKNDPAVAPEPVPSRMKNDRSRSGGALGGVPTVVAPFIGNPVVGTQEPAPASFAGKRGNLATGYTGAEVKLLQTLLNLDPNTRVAEQGPGSTGNETFFFGAATRAAVIKFQEKYAAEVLAPWQLTKGTGVVGQTTLAKLNAILKEFLSTAQ